MSDRNNNNNMKSSLIEDEGDDRKIAANAPGLVLAADGQDDYFAIARDLLSGEGDAILHNRFRLIDIPQGWVLEQYTTDSIVVVVGNDGITHILFGGTRNNDESWRPINIDEDAQLAQSVTDWALVPSKTEVTTVDAASTRRMYKRTLIRQFASRYSTKYYCKASDIVDKISSSDTLYKILKDASDKRPLDVAPFDWKTNSLYSLLARHHAHLNAKAEGTEEEENLLTDNDFDEPLVAFDRIVASGGFGPESQTRIDAIRSIFVNATNRADTSQEEMERLLRESQAYEGMERQTDEERLQALERRNNTLAEQNNAKRRKINRLEQFLLSVAEHHPFSESLWTDIFGFLGEGDADLKLRLQRKINESRRRFAFAVQSPSMNVDDSFSGVYYRSTLHCVPGAPNTA